MSSHEGRPELVIVRHGETDWTVTGQHTSRTDIPLTPNGIQQGEALGALLAGRRFRLVLTSPRHRAVDTCRRAGFGGQAVISRDLEEWDYGEFEGRTTHEIRQEVPGWSIWRDGCPGGETAADVGRRADRVIGEVRRGDGDVLAFAHGHNLRVLAARWVGLPPTEGRLMVLDTASLSVLGWEREAPVILKWNRTTD